MLTRQQIEDRLKGFQVPAGAGLRLSRVSQMARRTRGVAYGLLGLDPSGKALEVGGGRTKVLDVALEALDGIKPAERAEVWQAFFPSIVPHVERAWQLQIGMPYLVGAARRPFRAPNNPRASRTLRGLFWLKELLGLTEKYEQGVAWFAAWAPHLGWAPPACLNVLLAAAIDGGGPEGEAVFRTLCASASGEHEIGVMGRHVPGALLAASRPDGWAFVERMLLTAERQEGLRQAILETVDLAHPQAFRRMLRLVVEHNLVRFAATVRAAGTWFGLPFDVEKTRDVREVLEQALLYLEQPPARAAAVERGSGREAYLALWASAFDDAVAALTPATRLLSDRDPERRFAATYLLAQANLIGGYQAAGKGLGDGDLRVVWAAVQCYLPEPDERLVDAALFASLERVIARLPRAEVELEPVLWPWWRPTFERQVVAHLLIDCLGELPAMRLEPYLAMMAPYRRAEAVVRLGASGTADARRALFELLTNPAQEVRDQALASLKQRPLTTEEAVLLEGLAARKTAGQREGITRLLLGQKDGAVLSSARRLLEAPDPLRRGTGLTLLRGMVDAGRAPQEARKCAAEYLARNPGLPAAEQDLLNLLLDRERREPTLDDALGLMDPARRSRPVPPNLRKPPLAQRRDRSLVSEAAAACAESLDKLVHLHRAEPVVWELPSGRAENLLGDLHYFFLRPSPDLPPEENALRLPLREVWEEWWAARPPALRDPDGLELLRAAAPFHAGARREHYLASHPAGWLRDAWPLLLGSRDSYTVRYWAVVHAILDWLVWLHPPAGAADFLLDALDFALGQVPARELTTAEPASAGHVAVIQALPGTPDAAEPAWRSAPPVDAWFALARTHRRMCPGSWEARHHLRLWGLLRWRDEPGPAVPRRRPELEEVMAAWAAGGATEADILDRLLGPRSPGVFGPIASFGDLHLLTARRAAPIAERYPVLGEIAARCRQRIVEVELARSDLPAASSAPARALRFSGDAAVLVRLLQAMRDEPFERSLREPFLARPGVLSHLVRVSAPEPGDTPEAFASAVRAAGLGEKRLLELAAYAPQWARFVERALEWPGLEEAVWWLHAHAKDVSWSIDREVLEGWKAEVQQRTPLQPDDLLQGAADVAWFWRAYTALSEKRWNALDRAAPSTGASAGHKRARLFADAMRGRVDKAALLPRITQKRHQDSVRALGLLPLPEGNDREAEVLDRYQAIQEFVRTGAKFGAQRRENEKLAARIALENLARSAGYPDPQRLEWAMEARQSADLAAGPLIASAGEVTVTLSLDDRGRPQIAVEKGGKRLKEVPAVAKKDPGVVALRERARGLERQASRTRLSLEQAMCRGDTFTGAELRLLSAHPVLGPMIEDLVFLGEAAAGYPVDHGEALLSHDGRQAPVAPGERLRLAHPLDLLEARAWRLWQRECFLAERIQPFKQVFRELYLLTEAERTGGTASRRYAGHQVRPGQAQALLAGRGWIAEHEVGTYHTDHDSGISAWLDTPVVWFTPAEVEGTTIEGVHFTRRGDWQPMPLSEVPPRLFSEVMRDLDLVVSVAHAGAVDPEASASTVELRAGLVAETCAALKLENVRLQLPRALVDGRLASYSVHLGSAVVHQQPGGQVCIVPVHAQQRGRLFLPFADDDPKTAEVLSKVLLLARDWEIKDPVILEQILARR